MTLGQRISERLQALAMSQSELARQVGIAQSSVNALVNRNKVGSKHLHQIARVLQTTPAFLSGETDDPSEGYVPAPSAKVVAAELGLVAVRELDLTLGMGSTYLDVPVTETIRHFPIEWLRLYTRSDPENLIFAQGVGDSMMPTLLDSDLLLIDCSQQTLNVSDKIWAVSYAGLGAIKRLRAKPDGGVHLLSDNSLVPHATAYDGELHIMGRVVASVRKM